VSLPVEGRVYPPRAGFQYDLPRFTLYPTESSHGTPGVIVILEGRAGLVVVSGELDSAVLVAVAAYRDGERAIRAARRTIRGMN
jgi:hypothetical protein